MRTKLLILFIFATMVSYAQITTLGEPVKERPQIVYPQYDSLTNIEPCYPYPNEKHKSSYKHLIGQKVYVVNNDDYNEQLKKLLWPNRWPYEDIKNRNWNLKDHYMKIIDPQSIIDSVNNNEKYHSWRPNAYDIAFKDFNDGVVYFYEKEKCSNINKYVVVVGHFEKMKQLYEGKELVFVYDDDKMDYYAGAPYNCQNGIFDLNTRERVLSIKKGTRFQCTGISIDDQSIDGTKRGMAYANIPDRVVILLHNDELGDFYCYATSQDMKDNYDKKIQTRCKNYILGKFLFPEDYAKKQKNDAIAAKKKKEADQAKAEEAQAKAQERKEREQQRIQALVDKYGQSNVNLARQGKVKIGWNKELCKEAWGEPRSVNKTTTAYGVNEQWVYSTSRYLYFDNGVLTAIQE